MKKLLPALVLIFFSFGFIGHINSQVSNIEVSALGGYQFGGKIEFYEGKFKIQDAGNWAVGMALEVQPQMYAEFSYSSMTTKADFTPYRFEFEPRTLDIRADYFQLGVIRSTGDATLQGYGLFSMGAAWMKVFNDNVSDVWNFSVAIGGGGKYFFTDRVGIMVRGRLLMPLLFGGGGMFCGIGTGGANCGVGVSGWAPIVQGDLSGGLVFKLDVR